MRTKVTALACAGWMLAAASVAVAQDADHQVIPIWPAAAPGTTWSGPETDARTSPMRWISNVTTPTITVFRPAPGTANGNAMIVCPGGAFIGLAFGYEGTDVATWLAQRGVTAFVLKYRVHFPKNVHIPNSTDSKDFDKGLAEMEPGRRLAVADGVQALRYIRANAAYFGIKQDRIGIMGFSAGAMTTLGVTMDSAPMDRPNLAASIYGVMENQAVPSDAPPIFVAAAADDQTIPIKKSLNIFAAWHDAGRSAELHVYEKGGHGFGMIEHHTTSDNWTSDLENWLRAHGWITAANGP